MLEQEVVHLPEGALCGGPLGGLRGELGVRVDVVQRQVPPDVLEVAEVGEELSDDRLRLAAVRALEVAVLDERHEGRGRAADVVALRVDRDGEIDDCLRRAEQCTRAQRRRQQVRRPEDDPGEARRDECGREHAELRLLEGAAVEGQRRDQQRDREADPRDGAARSNRRPADRRAQTPGRQPRPQPRDEEDPGGLADDVADQDPQRDPRGERARQEAAADRDAGIRERE